MLPQPLTPLPRRFYAPAADVVAPLLLGHYLIRNTPRGPCGGLIVETEAYLADDPACHAYKRATPRNRTMWGHPGHAYVYRIYGYHFCINAICRPAGAAEAVLVRAVEPRFGLNLMEARRTVLKPRELTSGPAKLCAAMGIEIALDGMDLCDKNSPVFIARNRLADQARQQLGPLITTTRIGITRAADWPLRFYLQQSEYVSKRLPRPAAPGVAEE